MARPHVAQDFLAMYLPPQIKHQVNLSTLKLQNETFIDDRLKGHLVDLLYSVNFADQEGYIYILFEHLSTPDKLIAFRLLKYTLNIMDYHLNKSDNKKLPIIYPIVLYSGKTQYNAATNIFELFQHQDLAKEIMFCDYHLLNIHDIANEDVRNQLYFGLMIKAFRAAFSDDLQAIDIMLADLKNLEESGDITYLESMIKYILETGEIKNRDQLFTKLITNLSETTGEHMTTIADALRQEGRQEGWQKGVQEGEHKIAIIVKNLLREHEPIDKIAKITGLSKQQIEELRKKKL
jgi:predicted transposase/invertase (TIGR01784 family)